MILIGKRQISPSPQVAQSMKSVCLVIQSEDGHRGDYTQLFLEALPLICGDVSQNSGRHCLSLKSDCIFIQMIEGSYSVFLRSSILGLFGRHRTIGLLFRPREAIERRTFRHFLKYLFFRIFSRLPNVRVLTILPFEIEPQFAEIATGWIYDPQLWDLTFPGFETICDGSISNKIKAAASGRRVIMALGGQNREKGFDYLTNIWCNNTEIRSTHLFVVAGVVAAESKDKAAAFQAAGGILFDRRLEFSELMGLYSCADAVWSCYAPDYDQASGIFGRAFQLGIPAIVRSGSHIARLANSLNHETIELPFDNPQESATALMHSKPVRLSKEIKLKADVWEIRRRSLDNLRDAIDNGGKI